MTCLKLPRDLVSERLSCLNVLRDPPVQGREEVGGELGPRRSKCFDLPRDLVLKRLSRLNLLGDLPVQESQEVNMLRPAQGFSLQEAVMPQLA